MIASLILPLLIQGAEPPNPEWNCDEPMVQQEMNWCAGQDYDAADAELNTQWAIIRDAMKGYDADFEGGGDHKFDTRPGWFANLLEAQRGWLRYRDAHCALEGYEARGGSLEPLLALTWKARITRARIQELRELIERPEG
jgi:uncharacterized protein YecT (DUF1311 family)